MATVLESIVVARSSAALSPIAASSVSSFTGRIGLPHFSGLKVTSALRSSRSAGSLGSGPARRRRVLVACEAQGTAVEVFRHLFPLRFYESHFVTSTCPDGRSLDKARETSSALGAVASADGSTLVKIGSTTMLAAIKMEVMTPSQESPAEVPYLMLLCCQKSLPFLTGASIPHCVNGTNLIVPIQVPISLEDMVVIGAGVRHHDEDVSTLPLLYDFEQLEGELAS